MVMLPPVKLERVANTVEVKVVKHLEEMLERAKKGEIVGFAAAALDVDNVVTSYFSESRRATRCQILGALNRAIYNLNKDWDT